MPKQFAHFATEADAVTALIKLLPQMPLRSDQIAFFRDLIERDPTDDELARFP